MVPSSSNRPTGGYRWAHKPRWQCLCVNIFKKWQKWEKRTKEEQIAEETPNSELLLLLGKPGTTWTQLSLGPALLVASQKGLHIPWGHNKGQQTGNKLIFLKSRLHCPWQYLISSCPYLDAWAFLLLFFPFCLILLAGGISKWLGKCLVATCSQPIIGTCINFIL